MTFGEMVAAAAHVSIFGGFFEAPLETMTSAQCFAFLGFLVAWRPVTRGERARWRV